MREGVWLVAMLFAVAAVGSSVERLRRVHRVALFDLGALARALGRDADRARLREMRELMRLEGPSWEGELVDAVLGARSEAERTALVNEQLGDVASSLRWGSRIPIVAARLSALGSLCVLFFALASGGLGLADIVSVIAWGGAGMVGSLATGREADNAAAEMRRGIDSFVARVLSTATLPSEPALS
jgi:hypothetical protein